MTIYIFRLSRVRAGATAETIASDVCRFFGMESPIWSTLDPSSNLLIFHSRFDSTVVPDLVELSRSCDSVPFYSVPVCDAVVDLDLAMDEVSCVYHPCMFLVGVVLRNKGDGVEGYVIRRRLPELRLHEEESKW